VENFANKHYFRAQYINEVHKQCGQFFL